MALQALTLLPALLKMGTGLYQTIKGGEFGQKELTPYEIPKFIEDLMGNAEMVAGLRDLPGGDRIRTALGSSTAKGIESIKEAGQGSEMLGAITDLVLGEKQGLNQIELAAANQWLQNQGVFREAANIKAGYEDKKYQFNEYVPYMQSQAAASAMKGAGVQNIIGGITTGARDFLTATYMQKYLDKLDAKKSEWDLLKDQFKATVPDTNDPAAMAKNILNPVFATSEGLTSFPALQGAKDNLFGGKYFDKFNESLKFLLD